MINLMRIALQTEFKPSVSKIIISVESLSFTAVLHAHIPFVQGFVVGPIAKPSMLVKN